MASGFLAGATGGATVAIVIKAVDEFSGVMKGINGKMMALGTAVTAAGALGVKALGGLAFEAGKATGRIDAFNNMFGVRAPRALQELRDATRGTVSDIDLMTQANQALLLGIDRDALPAMFKGALAASQATGRPVSDAINDITVGIGRQSKLILDNLGILVSAETANEAYALALGKTTAELTDFERKAAFTAATMEALLLNEEKIGEVQDTLALKTQRMGAEWTNLKQTLGETLIPVFEDLIEIIKPVIGFMKEHPELTKFAVSAAFIASALALIVGPILIIKAALPVLIGGFTALSTAILPFTLVLGAVLAIALAIFGTIQLIIKLLNFIPGINIPTATLGDIGKG